MPGHDRVTPESSTWLVWQSFERVRHLDIWGIFSRMQPSMVHSDRHACPPNDQGLCHERLRAAHPLVGTKPELGGPLLVQ